MDDRTPRGVIQENLDHYTEIFAHKEPRDAPKKKKKKKKKNLVMHPSMTGHPGGWFKKTLATTLTILLAENLMMHQSEFWFMDNQVSEWIK